jgi:tetratricopeptide (TPR) repeat protein
VSRKRTRHKVPDSTGTRVQELLSAGRTVEARRLCLEYCAAHPRDPGRMLLMASIDAREGRFDAVMERCRQVLLLAPDNTVAWYNLGVAAQMLGRVPEAEQAYRELLARQPESASALNNLAALLLDRGVYGEALPLLERVVQASPGNAVAWFRLGQCQAGTARTEAALASYRKALSVRPDFPECSYALALQLGARGDYDEAQAMLRQLLARNPDSPDLVAALAGLYEFRGDRAAAMECLEPALQGEHASPKLATVYAHCAQTDAEREQALQLLDRILERGDWPEPDQRDACYAGAALHDRLGHYARAMAMYHRANRLEHAAIDLPAIEREFARIRAGFPVRRADSRPYAGNPSGLPVFVVGMPRSGTTLIEQVLASHSEVAGAGELDDIGRMAARLGRLGPGPYPRCLQQATAGTLDELAAGYLGHLEGIGAGARRVVDKMPHNFLALGLIDLLFPGARVIHCTRDPRDTCLSIYFRHFTANHPYAADLHALGRYYREYASLMRFWKSILRIPMREVAYEDMVEHPEQAVRGLLQFCGLAWEDRCLRHHENPRVVTTPTYQDIRKPLYRTSLARWRHYRDWLEPLQAGLGDEWPGETRVEREQT